MTERLHYADTYFTEFDAIILHITAYKEKYAVELDRTAFYPESGGQPSDIGTINGLPVESVIIKDGIVLHLMAQKPVHIQAHCVVDWKTRLDYTQQHTGQHLLSSLFFSQYGAITNSFHIGETISSIEINATDFNEACAKDIEEKCNALIFKNLAISAAFYDDEALEQMPLRKRPKVDENIRVVIIEDCDYSPCGGTHLRCTGELQLLKIKGWTRLNGWYKIEFLCGNRALKDFYSKNLLLQNLIAQLSSKEQELPVAVARCINQIKEQEKELIALKSQLAEYELITLMENTMTVNGIQVVKHIFPDADMNYMRYIATKITEQPNHIALLANSKENLQFLLTRAETIAFDLNKVVRPLLPLIQGKGGGNSRSVQGGGSLPEGLEQFFKEIMAQL